MSREISGMDSRVGGEADGWRVSGVGKGSAGSGMAVGASGRGPGVPGSGVGGGMVGDGVGVKVATRVGSATAVVGSGAWATSDGAPMPGPLWAR